MVGFSFLSTLWELSRISTISSETKRRGILEGVFAKLDASLRRGTLSAKCTAGPNILGYFLLSWP